MKTKIKGYAKEFQMYRCDDKETEICRNCKHWDYTPLLSTPIKVCLLNMDSIRDDMSCDKFKNKQHP